MASHKGVLLVTNKTLWCETNTSKHTVKWYTHTYMNITIGLKSYLWQNTQSIGICQFYIHHINPNYTARKVTYISVFIVIWKFRALLLFWRYQLSRLDTKKTDCSLTGENTYITLVQDIDLTVGFLQSRYLSTIDDWLRHSPKYTRNSHDWSNCWK